jgi:hypothetical protein
VSLPRDSELPYAGALLEPETMAPLLEGSLGRPGRLEQVCVARVGYKPRLRIRVHYEAVVDGLVENAVATSYPVRDLAAVAGRPALLELAQRVNGRSPAATPIVHEPAVDALLTWLPLDPRLPALAEPLGETAIVPESYSPGSRITLLRGRQILKAYGKQRSYERAVAGLHMAAASPLLSPDLEACFPETRLTVQTAVDGVTPLPEAAAERAGALVRRLQTADVTPPRVFGPDALLALAEDKAGLTASIVPGLEPRLAKLLEHLRKTLPPSSDLVPAHGDFDADQLVETENGDHVVLDFDDACLAPPALDLATYLADVVLREGEIEAVRRPLLAGYGGEPSVLAWHLAAVVLTRAPHPFQRLVPAWPERVQQIVRAAEEVLAG